MRPLTKTELLYVWEKGKDQFMIERALHLLSIACSVADTTVIARMSIGARDARLLQLREWMFGSYLINTAHCPSCAAIVEWENNTADLTLQTPQPETVVDTFDIEANGYQIRFRLPNSEDMARATRSTLYQAHPKKLLADCILAVHYEQQVVAADKLPDHVLDLISARMANEDPQANITMLLTCPSCTHAWEAPFDIISYLWTEIENWARQLLQEVYILARAFGWPEQDIINLSAYRRQLYIEMIRS